MEAIPWPEKATTTIFEKLLALKSGSIESCSVENLTEVGQNYGSTLLGIQLKVQDMGTLSLAGKFMPPTDDLKKIFGSATTFLKEIKVYRTINPELLKLQRERGVPEEEMCDPIPTYYGARTNSAGDESLPADNNAVLLLQNLTSDGYSMADQVRGLDMPHAEMLVTALARFQASVAALRFHKPHVFNDVIVRTCEFKNLEPPKGTKECTDAFMDHLSSFTELAPYSNKLRALAKRMSGILPHGLSIEVLEPYISLSHNDLWVNNIMYRYDSTKYPTSVKFFDFQTLTYSAAVRDLIFFLYTSLEYEMTGKSVDELMVVYYESFVKWLEKLGCSVAAFTEESFKKEIGRIAPTELLHILMMLNVVCAEKHEKIAPTEMKSFIPMFSSGELYRKRVLKTVEDFVERGWL